MSLKKFLGILGPPQKNKAEVPFQHSTTIQDAVDLVCEYFGIILSQRGTNNNRKIKWMMAAKPTILYRFLECLENRNLTLMVLLVERFSLLSTASTFHEASCCVFH